MNRPFENRITNGLDLIYLPIYICIGLLPLQYFIPMVLALLHVVAIKLSKSGIYERINYCNIIQVPPFNPYESNIVPSSLLYISPESFPFLFGFFSPHSDRYFLSSHRYCQSDRFPSFGQLSNQWIKRYYSQGNATSPFSSMNLRRNKISEY